MPTGPTYMAFSSEALDAKEVEGVIRPGVALDVATTPEPGGQCLAILVLLLPLRIRSRQSC